jgi:hypothetical protein
LTGERDGDALSPPYSPYARNLNILWQGKLRGTPIVPPGHGIEDVHISVGRFAKKTEDEENQEDDNMGSVLEAI